MGSSLTTRIANSRHRDILVTSGAAPHKCVSSNGMFDQTDGIKGLKIGTKSPNNEVGQGSANS
jgi:hypothetical protein